MTKLRVGISTCPNDTFAFYAVVHNRIDTEGLRFDVEYLDIAELNSALFEERFEVGKASFHAALYLSDRYGVYRSGAALGSGVGPLVLESTHQMAGANNAVLCPGEFTTATILYKIFFGCDDEIRHVVFSDIMPQLRDGQARRGVVIHEGRFTFQNYGLECLCDLGERWQEATGSLIPLGGILGNRDMSESLHLTINRVIRRSIKYACENREETLEFMRSHARELSDEAIWKHIQLYVNKYTLDLEQEGCDALLRLEQVAREKGVLTHANGPLVFFGESS